MTRSCRRLDQTDACHFPRHLPGGRIPQVRGGGRSSGLSGRGLSSGRPTPCPCQWRDRPPGRGRSGRMPRRLAIAVCAVALVTLAACGSSATSSRAVPASSSAQVTSPSVPALPRGICRPDRGRSGTKRVLRLDPANMDLTGPWLANDDGIYYLRQIEDALWWSGMSGQAGPPETLGRVGTTSPSARSRTI